MSDTPRSDEACADAEVWASRNPKGRVVPYRLAARMETEVREAIKTLKALLHDMPIPNCEWLHHRKADQNHAPTACPVEERINAAVERARLFIRNSNPTADRRATAQEGTHD